MIRAKAASRCILCRAQGRPLYSGLRDRLFSAPGEWSLVECPQEACGLIWLDPMPVPEDIASAYAQYYTHADGHARPHRLSSLFAAARRGYLANAWGYRRGVETAERLLGLLPLVYPGRRVDLDFSVMWLEPRAHGRLLDVGAGSGSLVQHMATLGWRAEGLDFDPRAVETARARGLEMHLGSLSAQRFAEASFDAVTMSHSIEHVHDPLAWLTEARRILVHGGRLVIATPNTRSMLHRWFKANWFALDPPRHLHLFNCRALASLLRMAGFQQFRVFTSVRDARGAWRGSRAIARVGRFDMLARPSWRMRLLGQAVQLSEGVLKVFDPEAGEDLAAVAVK